MDPTGSGWVWSADGVQTITGLHLGEGPPALPPDLAGVTAGFADSADDIWLAGPTSSGEDVVESSDGGVHWMASTLPLSSDTVHLAVTSSGEVLAMLALALAASQNPVALLRTTAGGTAWSNVLGGDIRAPLPMLEDKTGIAFGNDRMGWMTATTPATASPLLFATTDGGATWGRQTLPVPDGYAAASINTAQPVVFDQPGAVLVPATVTLGTAGGFLVYHETASGWRPSTVLTTATPHAHFVWSFLDADHGMVLAQPEDPSAKTVVYTTTDGGTTWKPVSTTAALDGVDHLAMLSATTAAAIAVTSGRIRLLHTADGGATWK